MPAAESPLSRETLRPRQNSILLDGLENLEQEKLWRLSWDGHQRARAASISSISHFNSFEAHLALSFYHIEALAVNLIRVSLDHEVPPILQGGWESWSPLKYLPLAL